ncbi:hypothetical protein [Confluentibacter lentus]|uniref:hypothetical protein n=1 Tax=Confluentibacter lentus TaxID=1699412 RepID=UPI000C289F54|nr:hypothetical protein [Confluentibacter lentus]
MKPLKLLLTLSVSILLFGCTTGNELRGIYIGNNNAFFEKLTFKSGNKVEIVFMDTTSEIDYQLDDDKVKIINAGQNQILIITDEGCLDGGGFIGTYCKE